MTAVRTWLETIGLAQYADSFRANDIDLDLLPQVGDQTLKDIGIASAGHRLRILGAIAKLSLSRSSTVSSHATERTPQETAERRQLTVMFCDLVGSTALSTRLDPEDLRAVINAYHRCCVQLVERNGGFVAKYMGDGVLAYFGYPRADEHDAEQALRAALALVEAVPKLATPAGSPLQVRVGISTGLVVVGDLIGSGASQEQAVVGETPNLAARLQALAEPGAVVISAGTRRLTGGLFEYRDLGAVAVKGFGDKVPAWQVTGAGVAESRFEALRATTTPLVGRQEEIELLLRRWERAKRGDGQVVLICGEPGIGKSRIAQTVLERIGAEPHTRLRYFCSPHHQDSAPCSSTVRRRPAFRSRVYLRARFRCLSWRLSGRYPHFLWKFGQEFAGRRADALSRTSTAAPDKPLSCACIQCVSHAPETGLCRSVATFRGRHRPRQRARVAAFSDNGRNEPWLGYSASWKYRRRIKAKSGVH
jgi:class 3 adenylate cyclase